MQEKRRVRSFDSFIVKNFSIIVSGSTNTKGPRLSSWHKANQKRLLSMNSDHKNSLAIRQDESQDIIGYLELIDAHKSIIDEGKNELSVHVTSHSTWTMSTVCLGALIIIFIWYSKRKPIELQHQVSIISVNSDYQLSESVFQSRYKYDYDIIENIFVFIDIFLNMNMFVFLDAVDLVLFLK